MSSQVVRKLLWYISWLICLPILGWGMSKGNLAVVGIALPLFMVCSYNSLQKLVCPSCGFTVRTISTRLTHCMKCGMAYSNSAKPATDSESDSRRGSSEL